MTGGLQRQVLQSYNIFNAPFNKGAIKKAQRLVKGNSIVTGCRACFIFY
jgi:hypothetical protein